MARAKPDLDWLNDAQAALNADPAFRKLGSADFKLGLSVGDAARIVTFEAFQITGVADVGARGLRDADVVLEFAPRDWNAFLRRRAKRKGESLLSRDLDRRLVKTASPPKRLLLERYNRTIQALLDKGASITVGAIP